jgi:hypothetical protein
MTPAQEAFLVTRGQSSGAHRSTWATGTQGEGWVGPVETGEPEASSAILYALLPPLLTLCSLTSQENPKS